MAIKRCTGRFRRIGRNQRIHLLRYICSFQYGGKYSYLSRRSLQSAETDPRVRKSAVGVLFLQDNDQTVGYIKLNWGEAQTEAIAPEGLEIERIYIKKNISAEAMAKHCCCLPKRPLKSCRKVDLVRRLGI